MADRNIKEVDHITVAVMAAIMKTIFRVVEGMVMEAVEIAGGGKGEFVSQQI